MREVIRLVKDSKSAVGVDGEGAERQRPDWESSKMSQKETRGCGHRRGGYGITVKTRFFSWCSYLYKHDKRLKSHRSHQAKFQSRSSSRVRQHSEQRKAHKITSGGARLSCSA